MKKLLAKYYRFRYDLSRKPAIRKAQFHNRVGSLSDKTHWCDNCYKDWTHFQSSKEAARTEKFGYKWWKYATNNGFAADLTNNGNFSSKSEVAQFLERKAVEDGDMDNLFAPNATGDWQSAGEDTHVDISVKPGDSGLYDVFSGGKKIGTYDPEVIYAVE